MELILVFIIGFLATFLGSFMSGGTSIISVTALTALLGIPPHTVLGTHRVGLVGADIGGILRYAKSGKVIWPLILPITILGLIGALIGVNIVLAVESEVLSITIGFITLLFIPLSIWKPHLGTVSSAVSKSKKLFGYASYFLASIWGSSFHLGVGMFITYTHLYFFRNTILETKATNKIPGLLRNLLALGFFVNESLVNWQFGFVLMGGMLIGSNLGAKYALKIGDSWLRYILLATIALFSVKLILGL